LEPQPDFFDKLGNISQDIQVQVSIIAPLAFRHLWSPYVHSLVLSSAHLHLRLFVFLLVLQIGMEFGDPFLIDSEQHKGVRVPVLVIHDLELAQIHWIDLLRRTPEDTSGLRVQAPNDD
jgi:hypothetical protein